MRGLLGRLWYASRMNETSKKTIPFLLVTIGGISIVLGTLLPWVAGSSGSDAHIVGNLSGGYGLVAKVFGLCLIDVTLLKKGLNKQFFFALGALAAAIAMLLGPHNNEAGGFWLSLSGASLAVLVLGLQSFKKMRQARGAAQSGAEAMSAEAAPSAALSMAEQSEALHKRLALAFIALLAGTAALFSTFAWTWMSGSGEHSGNYTGFDSPLRMTLIILVFSILVIVGSLIALSEPRFSKPKPKLLKAVRTIWVLAGMSMGATAAGVLIGKILWGEHMSGSLQVGPFVAVLASLVLIAASRSEWPTPKSKPA